MNDPMLLFGRAMRAVLEGRRSPLRFEHDSGDVATIDAGAFVRPFLFPEIERVLLETVEQSLPPGGRVLDVGCGSGRHARYLATRGLSVEGVEKSPAVAELARQLGASVQTASIWSVEPSLPPRTALLLGNSIGLVEQVAFLKPMFVRLAELAPVIVLDSAELGAASTVVEGRFSYEGRVGASFRWLHPSRADVLAAAEQAGLGVELDLVRPGGRYGLVLARRTVGA